MDDVAPASPHDPALPGRVATQSRTELPVLQSQRSPVAGETPSIAVAVVYAMATLVWLAFGDVLPGGRWLAVHLFTLGVLTNLVLTFSGHFARAITQQTERAAHWWPVAANVGVLAVIVGIPAASRALTATGATILSGAVFASYRRLRRMRRQAPEARFGWIVRVHERAHGAFLHGAILGALLGVGLVPGVWYGGVRIAHLHANVLGWGGLTLLSTLVFFGPSMARTRAEPEADAAAARALRIGASGLSVAVLVLIVTGVGGVAGATARVLAAGALGAFAWSVTIVCRAVVRATRRGGTGAAAPLVIGTSVWFVTVAWVDVAVVASGRWSCLDGLGVAALGGVLAQAVLATLLHLAPLLRDRTPLQRNRIRARLEVAARTRAIAFNTGVVLVVGSTALPLRGLAAGGWLLIGLVVTGALVVTVPTPRTPAHRGASRVTSVLTGQPPGR